MEALLEGVEENEHRIYSGSQASPLAAAVCEYEADPELLASILGAFLEEPACTAESDVSNNRPSRSSVECLGLATCAYSTVAGGTPHTDGASLQCQAAEQQGRGPRSSPQMPQAHSREAAEEACTDRRGLKTRLQPNSYRYEAARMHTSLHTCKYIHAMHSAVEDDHYSSAITNQQDCKHSHSLTGPNTTEAKQIDGVDGR